MPRSLIVAAVAALLLGLAWRLTGWDRSLWLDEVVTGTIALQPSFKGLIRDCLRELGGPVYYGFAWAWVKMFGASDLALRVPSFLFSVVAPILLLWRGHPDRQVRLVWGSLAALLFSLVYYSAEARSYSLLFLLGAIQAMLFGAMVRNPTTKRAVGWCLVSALMVLTHYFTLPLVGLQGLAYLALCGKRALKTWPATLVFLPALAWMMVHVPVLLSFADPQVAWQQILTLTALRALPMTVLGISFRWLAILLIAPIAATLFIDIVRWVHKRKPLPYQWPDLAIIAASLGAALFVIALGIVRPSFTPRYLVPFMPGLLLAPAIWSVSMGRRWPWVPVAMIAIFLGFALRNLQDALTKPERSSRTSIVWQDAAEALMANRVRHVVFFWDEVQTVTAAPDLLARAGGFFFDREGAGISVTPVILAGRSVPPDPNLILPETVDRTGPAMGRKGFIWIYHVGAGDRSIGNRYPPRLAELGGRFDCRDFATDGSTVILTCIRRDLGPA